MNLAIHIASFVVCLGTTLGPCLETELLQGLHKDIMYSLVNWSARRVEINLLAIKFCGTKYGACGSFLRKVWWSPCASKVDDLNIAASEIASDLSVQQATQFWRFLISLCLFVC
jgi:hypothetical protein